VKNRSKEEEDKHTHKMRENGKSFQSIIIGSRVDKSQTQDRPETNFVRRRVVFVNPQHRTELASSHPSGNNNLVVASIFFEKLVIPLDRKKKSKSSKNLIKKVKENL
jgi:hypothetical protein